MDLASIFSTMPNTSRLDALPEAWHWSDTPGFDFVATVSGDGKHVFQSHELDSYDEELAVAVLAFARAHDEELVGLRERPLLVIEGFAQPGRVFDILVALGPTVHGYHKDNAELHAATRAVFPAYRCEFAGDENEEEARFRYVRASGVRVMNVDREPNPYLRMRHKTSGGRVVEERGFAGLKLLVKELRALEDRPEGFVEFENYDHEVSNVVWDNGDWVLTGESEARRLGIDELLDAVKVNLYGPNLDAGTSQFP